MPYRPTNQLPFDSRNASGFDSAVETPFDSRRDQVFEPTCPIIAICDESVRAHGNLFMDGWENPITDADVLKAMDKARIYHPFTGDTEQGVWDADLIQWGNKLKAYDDLYDSQTTKHWSDRGVVRPKFSFHLIQPIVNQSSVPGAPRVRYSARGKLPYMGITHDVEWGANDFFIQQLLPPARNFPPEVRVDRVKIDIDRRPDPWDANSIGLWNVPYAKWTLDTLNKCLPGGINWKTIQNLNPDVNGEPECHITVIHELDHWFGNSSAPPVVHTPSSWLRIPDETTPNHDTPAFTLRTALRQSEAGNIKLTVHGMSGWGRWLGGLWNMLELRTNQPKIWLQP